MRLRADFDQPADVLPADYDWVASPASGVERMMLDRIGGEVARATSIVRFAPGSQFDTHTHDGGEEILVLKGVFSDETGDFPAGFYLRNPIGTSHRPHTDPGCTILVKLHQFDSEDVETLRIDTNSAGYTDEATPGVTSLELHGFGDERVRMLRLARGAELAGLPLPKGGELLVVEGGVVEAGIARPAGSWLRRPPGFALSVAAPEGALLWLKTGHLPA